MDEFYWENRPRYYAALDAVRREDGDLSDWLEYSAEGLLLTLERVWTRVQKFAAQSAQEKLVLRPRQEQLLQLLRDHKTMAPREIWEALGVSRQGAVDLLNPLIKAGLVKRIGTKKAGRYILSGRQTISPLARNCQAINSPFQDDTLKPVSFALGGGCWGNCQPNCCNSI